MRHQLLRLELQAQELFDVVVLFRGVRRQCGCRAVRKRLDGGLDGGTVLRGARHSHQPNATDESTGDVRTGALAVPRRRVGLRPSTRASSVSDPGHRLGRHVFVVL